MVRQLAPVWHGFGTAEHPKESPIPRQPQSLALGKSKRAKRQQAIETSVTSRPADAFLGCTHRAF